MLILIAGTVLGVCVLFSAPFLLLEWITDAAIERRIRNDD